MADALVAMLILMILFVLSPPAIQAVRERPLASTSAVQRIAFHAKWPCPAKCPVDLAASEAVQWGLRCSVGT